MICPYCKKEMEEGFIPAITMRNQWIKKDGKIPATIFTTSKDGFAISEFPLFTRKKTIANYCSECETIIISVKKNE
ncbi:conserved hypothetical protein [Alteracholeplasma palmae J233]|uniref:DUF6487 domain-containing protein n=1 Tax=Alteracholeplasma palmae (strain ATCC 49389 / J233) TaxID=1318466 RepID=U4KRR2_ALTPJ|nr:PF20097 family protein [Alteracholeplasma palmae]CCV64386.1 conserved hypothetical protein [Alteracholeplasma palmae J233]